MQEGRVELRIKGTPTLYTFSFTQMGEFKDLGTVGARFLSTETNGGFTGAFIGMYATGNGKNSTSNADFDWFEYEGKD